MVACCYEIKRPIHIHCVREWVTKKQNISIVYCLATTGAEIYKYQTDTYRPTYVDILNEKYTAVHFLANITKIPSKFNQIGKKSH